MNNYSYYYMNCSRCCEYIFKLFVWCWMNSIWDISVRLFRSVFCCFVEFFSIIFSMFYFLWFITFYLLTKTTFFQKFFRKQNEQPFTNIKTFPSNYLEKNWHFTWKTYFLPGNFRTRKNCKRRKRKKRSWRKKKKRRRNQKKFE